MTLTRLFWNASLSWALVFTAAHPVAGSDPTEVYNTSLLGSLAADARYDKPFPEYLPCPENFSNAQITFDNPTKTDTNTDTNSGVDEKYVRNALRSYFVRNGDDWRNSYSQSDGGVTGYVVLPNPNRTKLRWLVRAGGLALLLYPDGGVVYLAREITTNWKTVTKLPWATVQVERKLYRKNGSDRFFVHVNLTNTSSHAVAFDKTERTSVFYPNQWAESQTTTRQMVNECRPVQNPLTESQTGRLIELMNAPKIATKSSLVTIKPGEVYEYFISFNSGTRSAIEHTKSPYIILVMDGNMALTDGKSVKQLKRDQADSVRCEVPIRTPIVFSLIPDSANVIFQD
jgi:hypothetical protein